MRDLVVSLVIIGLLPNDNFIIWTEIDSHFSRRLNNQVALNFIPIKIV